MASWLRSSGVMLSIRRLPPFLPPFVPIADMTREISDLVIFAGFVASSGLDAPAVESSTIRNAAWFTSIGLALLLIRFGIVDMMPEVVSRCESMDFQSSPLPRVR